MGSFSWESSPWLKVITTTGLPIVLTQLRSYTCHVTHVMPLSISRRAAELPDWPTLDAAEYARLEATATANYAGEGNYNRSTAPPPSTGAPASTTSPEQKYSALMNRTCTAVVAHLPVSHIRPPPLGPSGPPSLERQPLD